MTKVRIKQILAAVLLGMAALSAIVVTGRLGRVVELMGTGADPATTLTEVVIPVDPAEIRWQEDALLPRAMEPGTRTAIGEAYLVSLALLDGSITIPDSDLAVHLTGPALRAARTTPADATVTDRSHRMRVVFYSADGQLVELEDESTRIIAINRHMPLVRTERAVAVMVSIDGVWHLRHRLVTDSAFDITTPATTAQDHGQPDHVSLTREETP
jgi:hypothetical protein